MRARASCSIALALVLASVAARADVMAGAMATSTLLSSAPLSSGPLSSDEGRRQLVQETRPPEGPQPSQPGPAAATPSPDSAPAAKQKEAVPNAGDTAAKQKEVIPNGGDTAAKQNEAVPSASDTAKLQQPPKRGPELPLPVGVAIAIAFIGLFVLLFLIYRQNGELQKQLLQLQQRQLEPQESEASPPKPQRTVRNRSGSANAGAPPEASAASAAYPADAALTHDGADLLEAPIESQCTDLHGATPAPSSQASEAVDLLPADEHQTQLANGEALSQALEETKRARDLLRSTSYTAALHEERVRELAAKLDTDKQVLERVSIEALQAKEQNKQLQEQYRQANIAAAEQARKVQYLESAVETGAQSLAAAAAERDDCKRQLAQMAAERSALDQEMRSLTHQRDEAEQSNKAAVAALQTELEEIERAAAPDYCFGPARELFQQLRQDARNGKSAAAGATSYLAVIRAFPLPASTQRPPAAFVDAFAEFSRQLVAHRRSCGDDEKAIAAYLNSWAAVINEHDRSRIFITVPIVGGGLDQGWMTFSFGPEIKTLRSWGIRANGIVVKKAEVNLGAT